MKTIIKISLPIFIILILYTHINAQDKKVNVDCLQIGDVYRVTVMGGWVTEGRLLKIDTASIEIKSLIKIFSIPKSQITSVQGVFNESGIMGDEQDDKVYDSFVKDSSKNKKIYLSFGGGAGLPSFWSYNSYNTGINLQVNVMKIISYSHAIRGDFQFTHNTRIRDYSSRVSGGQLNTYGIRVNFLLGNFKKRSIVNGYAILGGGLSIQKQADTKYSYPVYDPVTMSYTGETETHTAKHKAYTYVNLDAGGGLSYKISDKVKLYGEAQYTLPLELLGYGIGGFGPYVLLMGSPSLRLGAQIEL